MKYFQVMNTVCSNLGVSFNKEKYYKFMKYKEILKLWNNKINLTAIVEDEDIIKKHFVDCIEIFKFSPMKNVSNIIDIGTGAGFPGIPIKIIDESKKITLLDSLNKRINFLNQVILDLKLEGISCIHGRAEDFSKKVEYREKFDAAVSRAVANLTVLSEFCIPYVKTGGYFIAMKGPAVEDEIKESKNAINILGGKVEDIVKVENDNLDHNLVIIKKIRRTSKTYPRKPGIVAKKPLK
ncbi:16S rRNA (guanine(527)-N(7))-methyltransferase RsmG [Clostridium luticellarii]|jgi:16S rRNA (guanine527-N7)-methyltransferase|uniref:Ribosomal RNA small subunit methyltransferase G n=1 Tax=Clostridium luticellarii TaxID=1691940 RepID=A0A2T0B767_9CLOT|nr:16S rRNA (guanine(527)-N(7))-methyltransferase RsmG [Clostridium luticellarii]MCI1945853.1 16S rRNA (guanine(527)-N(7))-methyltransferase RsmG [Clostridium luticellarii]MCI1969185.1 16S rRNA (guanine(527)-N(7))-methyltransferase RsmG [Clostridium luticellarii]MCI1996171.1 16S rRNA (guanine(527)-N(7))-methyltransferase RsmG [Clostridium luticellarii]MCI2040496.1 16S rRNA (guanine(527)-N(7))-methyltransferase RsmG [Clostridium luticellarii]PRR79726.1 Ribosomal RNA small subunit methyltransfer